MADNMAIGPSVTIGGNKVQMEVKPRFVVTDKKVILKLSAQMNLKNKSF